MRRFSLRTQAVLIYLDTLRFLRSAFMRLHARSTSCSKHLRAFVHMFANHCLRMNRALRAHASTSAYCHLSLRWTLLSKNTPADIQNCTQAVMRKTRRDSCSMLVCARIQLRILQEQHQVRMQDVVGSTNLIRPIRTFILRACVATCLSLPCRAQCHAYVMLRESEPCRFPVCT